MSEDPAATNGGLAEAPSNPFLFDASVFDRETPDYLVPKMGGAISEPAYFQQIVIRDPHVPPPDEVSEITGALDPFAATSRAQPPQRPVQGVLLTFEQAWRQDHLALGRLLHSLCLAPGEVTKIAVMDFSRRTSTRRTESTTQTERVTATDDVDSAQQEVQRAVAKDLQSSTSMRVSSASHSEAAASGGGLLFSAGGATSRSSAIGVASATGAAERDVATSAAKGVQQRTVATSQAVRGKRSTQVQEVSESEQQTATTRVIANYNHMHALTMMFFEVIQIFKLSTRTIDAERVVFLPMKEIAFNDTNVRAHAETLLQILAEAGRTEDVKAFRAYFRADTAGMRGKVERLALDGEQAIDAAANRLELKAQITLRPPNLSQIEDFFDSADAAIDKLRAMQAGLDQIEKDIRLAEGYWENLQQASNVRTRGMFEGQVRRLGQRLNIRHAINPSRPDPAAVKRFLDQARTTLADRRQQTADIPQIEEALAAARAALEALQKAEAELDEALRIVRKIDTERLAFNQELWLRTDPSQYQRMVQNHSFRGQPLGHLMDPRPLTVFGSYVVFRLPHGHPGEDARFAEPYTSQEAGPIAEDIIAMPSGGVFGEAVLGQAIAAEKIDLTRFWNWQDSPIPILPPAMQPVALESRARDVAFSPATLEPALAEIIQRELPEGVEAAPIVKAVSDHLRASTGADGLDALLAAQVAAAQAGAAAAGDRTVQTQKNLQDFTVGMANSELGKAAATALVPKAGGSATVLGGVLGGAKPAGNGKAAPAEAKTGEG